MDEDEIFTMTLVNKASGNGQDFQAKTYSVVISKAYCYMLGELRNEDNRPIQ
jgi:hypothetical protein